MMHKRSTQKEWMDLGPPFCTKSQYEDALFKLGRVGKLLGGDRASHTAFSSLKKSPTSILDVGCGGGDFTLQLARRFPLATVVGVDISHEAIDYAKKQQCLSNNGLNNVSFIALEGTKLPYASKSFDVVTSTLVCHHLNDDELICFITASAQIARNAVILNDLHRHPVAFGAYAILAPLLFQNRMITHDGLISIKRSFKRNELVSLLDKAKVPTAKSKINWHFPFRWTVSIDTEAF